MRALLLLLLACSAHAQQFRLESDAPIEPPQRSCRAELDKVLFGAGTPADVEAAVRCYRPAKLPPVTQDEAIRFHAAGLCQMAEPGNGITRSDGQGWIASPLPGRHVVTGIADTLAIDFTPGKPVRVRVTGPVTWCPQFRPPGRDMCGPVPLAFLYDAKTAPVPKGK